MYEDHENLVDNLMQWTRDSPNVLRFQERSDKYDLFVRPELYLLPTAGSQQTHLDDDGRAQLIEVGRGRGICGLLWEFRIGMKIGEGNYKGRPRRCKVFSARLDVKTVRN